VGSSSSQPAGVDHGDAERTGDPVGDPVAHEPTDSPDGAATKRRLGCLTFVALAFIPAAAAWFVAIQASPREMYPLAGMMSGLAAAVAWAAFAGALAVALWPARRGHRRRSAIRWFVVVSVGVGATVFTWSLVRLPTPSAGLRGESADEGRDMLIDTITSLPGADHASVKEALMSTCVDDIGRDYGARRVGLITVEVDGSILEDLPAMQSALEKDGWSVDVEVTTFRGVEGRAIRAHKSDYAIVTTFDYASNVGDETTTADKSSISAWSPCLRP
jgi:hypothetical protein